MAKLTWKWLLGEKENKLQWFLLSFITLVIILEFDGTRASPRPWYFDNLHIMNPDYLPAQSEKVQ